MNMDLMCSISRKFRNIKSLMSPINSQTIIVHIWIIRSISKQSDLSDYVYKIILCSVKFTLQLNGSLLL